MASFQHTYSYKDMVARPLRILYGWPIFSLSIMTLKLSKKTKPLSIITLCILLSSYMHSTLSFPLSATPYKQRVGISRLEVVSDGHRGGDGCTYEQIIILKNLMSYASDWAWEAHKVFQQNSADELAMFAGVEQYLSRDRTTPSDEAFSSRLEDEDLDENFTRPINNLKRDAGIHLGNVYTSFENYSPKLSIVGSTTILSNDPDDNSFLFSCFNNPNTKGSKTFCSRETYYAGTTKGVMGLCPKFFKAVTNELLNFKRPLEEIQIREAIDKSIARDKFTYKNNKFPDLLNPVSILLHEAQHSAILLKLEKGNLIDQLEDVPNGRSLYPNEIRDPNILKVKDRSRNAENWAIVASLINFDKRKFIGKSRRH